MILVTGGTGLVGSHLLYYLSQKEQRIRAIFRDEEKLSLVKRVFAYYSDKGESLFNSIEWKKATLSNLPLLDEIFDQVTHVYHCAALVSFDPSDYRTLRKVNINGTANIVNLCIKHKVNKLCYVSSVAALGGSFSEEEVTEDMQWNPDIDHSVYAITKYGAELEVWRGSQEGVDTVIVNPGIIIGPGFWRSSSGSLFTRVYRGIRYFTTGTSGYIDIHDVVLPMIQLMESNIKNERFILIGENLDFKSFIEKVAIALDVDAPKKKASPFMLGLGWRMDWLRSKVFSKRRRLTRQMTHSLVHNTRFANRKIIEILGYRFKPLNQSIEETATLFLKDLD